MKKSFTLLMLLTLIIGSRTSAQDFSLEAMLERIPHDRAREVLQDNEYTNTGYEQGNFYTNPLMLNGKPLDYTAFHLKSTGELTVIKGAAITAKTIEVPFYVYLRRDGNKVVVPGKESPDPAQINIELSEVLKHAQPGDLLVIEPVRREDGPAKRILKLLKGGC